MGSEPYSIVNDQKFIEATRNSGYESTVSAFSEIVDNSLQANAKETAVHFILKPKDPNSHGRAMRVVEQVVFVDDGDGMDAPVLREALRFGGSSRFNDRSGLGRFGMGLPNASFSQCRRLEVYSRTKNGKFYFSCLDIDEIVAGTQRVIPEPTAIELPRSLQVFFLSEHSGTVIVWKKCDRLDYNGRDRTIANSAVSELGRVFRHYLFDGSKLFVHNEPVEPIDPLFLDARCEFNGAREKLSHPVPVVDENGEVRGLATVRISILPEAWFRNQNEDIDRKKLLKQRPRGFSVLRNGREIDYGLFGLRTGHWICDWWGGEIDFKPELDEAFGVTHTKQGIKIGGDLVDCFKKAMQPTLGSVSKEIEEWSKKKAQENNLRKSEDIASEFESHLGTSRRIAEKSKEQVETELESSPREFPALPNIEKRLRKAHHDEKPFMLDFVDEPGLPFFRYREVGKVSLLVMNRHHAFFDRLYKPLCDAKGDGHIGLELLLVSLVKGHQLQECTPDELDNLLQFWSECLAAYLSGPGRNQKK